MMASCGLRRLMLIDASAGAAAAAADLIRTTDGLDDVLIVAKDNLVYGIT